MILTRIKRGAARTRILAQYRINRVRLPQVKLSWNTAQKVALSLFVARIVFNPVIAPLAAQAQVPSEDTDPSPISEHISGSTASALTFNPNNGPVILVSAPALNQISVGESLQALADQQAAAQAAQVAAEQAAETAQAAAAAQAAEAARIAAQQAAAEQAANAAIIATSNSVAEVPVDKADMEAIVRAAADKYGVDEDLLVRIGMCESGLNPNSRNHGGSHASGMFQFMPSTFANTPPGQEGRSIWDPTANAEAAAWKIANGGINAWAASRSCWDR